eukprot:10310534-Alexandrium_andersonii.AAC.1
MSLLEKPKSPEGTGTSMGALHSPLEPQRTARNPRRPLRSLEIPGDLQRPLESLIELQTAPGKPPSVPTVFQQPRQSK